MIPRSKNKTQFSNMRFRLSILILLLSTSVSFAQKGAKNPYQFTITNLKDTVVYLANYYGERLYYADTAYADAKGQFSFKRVESKNEGKYAVVIPGPKYFEMIVADGEDIEIHSDTTDLVKNLKVIKSANNKLIYDYVNFLTERRKEREVLIKKLEESEGQPDVTAAIKTEYNVLNDKVTAYQKQIVIDNPTLFAAKEIRMGVDPAPPAELLEDRTAAYNWYRKHYWDYIDLQDDRIVRTPVFHTKLDNFLNKTLIQDPDTITQALDELIGQLNPKSEVFKYTVHYSTYTYETSKIMGMDKVFVHLVDKWYKSGKAFWLDSEKTKSIVDKADEKRYTLIGLKAPELILMDSSGTWIGSQRDLKTKYLVLYFYDPDCGHCKKDTPKLVEFYKNYPHGDLSIMAVSSNRDQKWLDFIKKNEMSFYNVTIPDRAYNDADYATDLIRTRTTTYESLKYQESFDVQTTPKIIILDENRIIRAKDIAVEQVGTIINRLEGRPDPVKPEEIEMGKE